MQRARRISWAINEASVKCFRPFSPLKPTAEWKNHFPVKCAKVSKSQVAAPWRQALQTLLDILLCTWCTCVGGSFLVTVLNKQNRKEERRKGYFFFCYFVLAKGNIKNSEMYTCLCKQGTREHGQFISSLENSSLGEWVKEQSRSQEKGLRGREKRTAQVSKEWGREQHVDKRKSTKQD